MILSDSAILRAIEIGDIVIDPFDRSCLGPNSYDVHLGPTLLQYELRHVYRDELDCKQHTPTSARSIPDEGLTLLPGVLYLASTVEYTETHRHVPYLDGKSSIGRLGIFIHATAGRGDVGFCNHWTLELSVVQPVRIYAGMPIGQLTYHSVEGDILVPYNKKPSSKYTERQPSPQPSMMWRNFQKEA